MTLINYYKETIRFVNSLVIKIDEIRIHQNYHSYVKRGITPPDLLNSKYYQNISGTLNLNDIPVTLSNGKILTRDLILNDSYTKSVLLNYGDTYNKLIVNNPGMSDYIRGCLIDIDIDTLISLDNYSIVSYNKNLLQENEAELLLDIEKFVFKIMTNYNNNKFMIDELYLPALLGNLYSSLVLYIISRRFGNIKSNKVDKFHLEKHLMSYKYLYNDSSVFDLPTNIYLYGNITRLKHMLGRNIILEEYMNNVYVTNNIGIGLFKIYKLLPEINQNNFNDIYKEFYNSSYRIQVSPANKSLYMIKNKKYTLSRLDDLLLENNIGDTTKNNYKDKLDKELTINKEITKGNLFVIDQPEKIRINENNNFVFLISNLIDIFYNNKLTYNFTLDYTSIIDFKLYKLSVKDMLNIILYNLYKLNNITVTDFSIVCNNVFNNNLNKNNVLQRTWYKDRMSSIYDYITNDNNLNVPVINMETFRYYLTAIRGLDAKIWFTMSNIVDNTAKTDISTISNILLNNRERFFNIDTIISELNNNSLNNFTLDYSLDILIDIVEKISNIPVDDTKLILDKMFHIRSFFNKTTSYTIDLIIDNTFINKEIINSDNIDINLGYKPFIQINNISFKLYEELNFYILSSGFIDQELNIYNPELNTINYNAYTKSLPLMFNGNNYNTPFITGRSKKLYGKPYKHTLEFKNIIDNKIITINEKSLLNVTGIRRYIPTNIINNSSINNVAVLQGNVGFRYKGKPYVVYGVKTFDVGQDSQIESLDNTSNIDLRTEKIVNISVMEELNTMYIESNNSGIYRTNYSPDIDLDAVTDNDINETQNSVATVIKSGKIGTIKVMPYDNINDGVDITILNK